MTERSDVALFFDPPSRHFLADKLFDREFAGHAGDQILEPYAYLKDFLSARGIPVHTADRLPSSPDGVRKVYVSSGTLANYRRLATRSDVILSAFFAMECPTVDALMYRELGGAQHVFKRIYTWSDSASLEPFVGRPLRCLPVKWPQSFNVVHEPIWSREGRGFLVMLNGNKLPRHQTPCRELYSERLRAVEYFSRTGEIDLYGHGWDTEPYRVGPWAVPGTFGKVPMPGTVQFISRQLSAWRRRLVPDPRLIAARKAYRGFATSKSETLGRYKFSLCFENSVLKGWITEKIFDCFFAGTVPIYWGAPDIEDHVPANCFIDKRRFEDYAELRAHLKSLTERDVQAYKDNARDFIGSPRFQPFTKQAFAEVFRRIIEEDTGMALDASASNAS